MEADWHLRRRLLAGRHTLLISQNKSSSEQPRAAVCISNVDSVAD